MNTVKLTEEKIWELNELSLELGQAAQRYSPQPSTWGLYSAMNGPTGLSAGGFLWFETREKMIEFIEIFPFWAEASREDEEWEAVVSIAQQYAKGELSAEAACEQINDVLHDPTINWIGTLDDLMNGRGDFAQEFLEEFREDNEDEEENEDVQPPVRPEEIEKFLNYVKEYID